MVDDIFKIGCHIIVYFDGNDTDMVITKIAKFVVVIYNSIFKMWRKDENLITLHCLLHYLSNNKILIVD